MTDKLIDALLTPVTSRLIGRATGPVLAFWAAGALLWLSFGPPLPSCPGTAPWCAVPSGTARILTIALIALLVVIGSAVLTAHAARGWVGWLSAAGFTATRWGAELSRPLSALAASRRARLIRRIASTVDGQVAAAVWRRARRYPSGRPLPVWMANALAATHQRMRRRYGLDLSLCWGLLLEVTPDAARQRLTTQLALIVDRAQAALLSLAATAFTPLLPGWWPRLGWIVVSLAGFALCYAGMREATGTLCDMAEDFVTLHRPKLYAALGFSVPRSTDAEPSAGAALSAYLGHSPVGDMPLSWH